MKVLVLAVIITLLPFSLIAQDRVKGEIVIDLHPVAEHKVPGIANMVKPEYPHWAIENDIYSRVVVKIVVIGTGDLQIRQVTVTTAKAGAKEYGFDSATLKAIALWQFKSPGVVLVEFRFR